MRIKTTFRRIALLTMLLVFAFFSFNPTWALAAPVSDKQMGVFNDGFNYFNYEDDCESTGGAVTVGTGTGVPGAGVWNSGLQPKFIIEQFAIETLKNVAAKKNVDPSNAVTEEHVIGLIAFMVGEGGDINNRWLYNPLNSGIKAPELIDGAAAGNGTQSFKSFDAGVEATARTMTGKLQSRLGEVLTKKDSTAEQFMDALTHYLNYPGNLFWAEASLPPNTASYYAGRLRLVNQVRNNYENIASTVMGTPAYEIVTKDMDKSKLQFHPAAQNNGKGRVFAISDSTAPCGSSAAAAGSSTGGCPGGKTELKVPAGGTGVNVCYFAQCDSSIMKGGGFDWCGCGCEPTSTLMVRSTFEKNPTLDPVSALTEVRAAGGVSGDNCSGNWPINWLKGYLKPKGYTVEAIHDRPSAPTDADLAKVKQMLGQGYLIFTHTHNWIGSDLKKGTYGHYLLLHAVDAQGNFYAANPGDSKDNNKPVSPDIVKKWLDEFYAVKKFQQV